MTPYNTKAIADNLRLVFTSGDIRKLNQPTYTFISLMSGFIAHYNLYGFQDEYTDLRQLATEILQSERDEEYYGTQWFIDRYGTEYPASKVATIKAVHQVAKEYLADDQK